MHGNNIYFTQMKCCSRWKTYHPWPDSNPRSPGYMPSALTAYLRRWTLRRCRYFVWKGQHTKCQLCTGNNTHFRLLRSCHWKKQKFSASSNESSFRVTGPFCGESTVHRWIPLTKASDAEFWCVIWSALEAVEQTIDTPVIWDATALIMTSL